MPAGAFGCLFQRNADGLAKTRKHLITVMPAHAGMTNRQNRQNERLFANPSTPMATFCDAINTDKLAKSQPDG
jgi:hypothetical protein